MLPIPPVRRAFLAAAVAGALLVGGCEGLPTDGLAPDVQTQPAPLQIDRPPLPRHDGPRLPAFSGGDPAARDWMKVDDLLWIERRDEAAYRKGLVTDGVSYVSVDAAPTRSVSAEAGFRLRTDHLAVYTNASWRRALQVAREAELHVTRLVRDYGEPLDLRLPQGPMKVIVTATRKEFVRTLRGLVHDPVGWGAFYDARSGNVYVSLEPAKQGPLPWRADLRHEMTHQILDLSRPLARRARPFATPWFWLWEAFSVWSEGLGDLPGDDTLSARLGRFRRKYAWGEWTPLASLFALEQESFAGQHYDQTASLMRFLLDEGQPARRNAVLNIIRRLLSGPVPSDALARALGMTTAEIETAWRETVQR